MDQPIYLLLGAGILICVIAFFVKKTGGRKEADEQQLVLQRKQERAEMEKSLQRFVQQVKQENELVVANLRKTKENLRSDLDQLEMRMHAMEAELQAVHAQLGSMLQQQSAEPEQVVEESRSEPEKAEDTLFLRERFQKAFELRQSGKSIDEIAKELGAGRGEIELIFSLAAPLERGGNHG